MVVLFCSGIKPITVAKGLFVGPQGLPWPTTNSSNLSPVSEVLIQYVSFHSNISFDNNFDL